MLFGIESYNTNCGNWLAVHNWRGNDVLYLSNAQMSGQGRQGTDRLEKAADGVSLAGLKGTLQRGFRVILRDLGIILERGYLILMRSVLRGQWGADGDDEKGDSM